MDAIRPDLPSWASVVHVYATSSGGEPEGLVPGVDVVLDAPIGDGLALAHGVLLDDWLDQATRAAIDVEAIRRVADWRAIVNEALTVDDIPVAHIWEHEVLADVFLPVTRIVRGLERAFERQRPSRLVLHGLNPDLEESLADLGIAVEHGSDPIQHERVPSQAELSWQISAARRRAIALFALLGVPGLPRGRVVIFPYWHLTAVFVDLLEHGPIPLLYPGRPPAIPRRMLARAFARGGWLPYPNGLARRRSRRQVKRAVDDVRAASLLMPDTIAAATHRRALDEIARRAGDTLAITRALARGFRRAQLVVLPFDSMFDTRMFIHAARIVGIPTLVVQHGYCCEPNEPDKELGDNVAVWSERDRHDLTPRTSGAIIVTGNPGASRLSQSARRGQRRGRTLVLVQDPSRHSTRSDTRVSMRHVRVALNAVSRARPGTAAVLRPHPSDPNRDAYLAIGRGIAGVATTIETNLPIEQLVATVDLCIGAMSTASLQAGVAGVPVAFLNTDGAPRAWPFDGNTVPTAHNEDELVMLIGRLLETTDVPGNGEMAEALGVRADAVERVLSLIRRLVESQPANSLSSSP